jgi:hypothetical protein
LYVPIAGISRVIDHTFYGFGHVRIFLRGE